MYNALYHNEAHGADGGDTVDNEQNQLLGEKQKAAPRYAEDAKLLDNATLEWIPLLQTELEPLKLAWKSTLRACLCHGLARALPWQRMLFMFAQYASKHCT